MPFKFTNAETDTKFEVTPDVETDFKIVNPTTRYSGFLSAITPDVAEQMIKEKVNYIKLKKSK